MPVVTRNQAFSVAPRWQIDVGSLNLLQNSLYNDYIWSLVTRSDMMPLVGPSVHAKSDDEATPHGLEGWALARNIAKAEGTVDATLFVMISLFHK